jgi:hypothetical protein
MITFLYINDFHHYMFFVYQRRKNDTIEKYMSIYEFRWRKFATSTLIVKVINRRILQRHRYSLNTMTLTMFSYDCDVPCLTPASCCSSHCPNIWSYVSQVLFAETMAPPFCTIWNVMMFSAKLVDIRSV